LSAQRAVRQFADNPDQFATCVYQALLDKSEWRLARAAFECLQLKPDDPRRECSFAQAYWKSQDAGVTEKPPADDLQQRLKMETVAVSAVEDAAKKLPDSFTAHLTYGEFIEHHLMPSMDHSQIGPMIREYKRAVELRPDVGDAHYHLAMGYMYPPPPDLSSTSKIKAIDEFTKAVELDPRLSDSYYRISCLYTYSPRPDYATAYKYMEKFLSEAPDQANRTDVALARADEERHIQEMERQMH
jgi:tetratricopeptide (TPR) repeat protein